MDPMTAIAAAQFVFSLFGAGQQAQAQKALRKLTNRELHYQAGVSHDQFDTRYGAQNRGDLRQLEIENQARGANDQNIRAANAQQLSTSGQGFDRLLSLGQQQTSDSIGLANSLLGQRIGLQNDQQGRQLALTADMAQRMGSQQLDDNADQIGIGDTLLNSRMGAEHSLLDTLRDVRTGNLALSADERARQEQFQGLSDVLARNFVDSSGAGSFGGDRAAGFGSRLGALDAAIRIPASSTPVPLIGSANPVITRAFADQQERGIGQGLEQAANQAQLSSYTDALHSQDRRALNFGEQVSMLDDRAGRSASNLMPQLNVNAIRANNATQGRDASVSMAEALADALRSSHSQGAAGRQNALAGQASSMLGALRDRSQGEGQAFGDLSGSLTGNLQDDYQSRSGSQSNFTRNLLNSFGSYYDGTGQSLDQFYSREGGAEGDYTGRLVDASNALEQGLVNLSNLRINSAGSGSQSAGSGFGALSQGLSLFGNLFGGGGFKGLPTGKTTTPKFSGASLPPVAPFWHGP